MQMQRNVASALGFCTAPMERHKADQLAAKKKMAVDHQL